jgi:hypothetical protein
MTGSGKSVLNRHILYECYRAGIPEAFVFSGTESEDPFYFKHILSSYIYDDYNEETLKAIFSRQQERAEKFRRARMYIKKVLFPRYATRKMKRRLKNVQKIYERAVDSFVKRDEAYKLWRLRHEYRQAQLNLFKSFVSYYKSHYPAKKSVVAKLKPIYTDPRIIIVIDDCQYVGSALKKSRTLKRITFNGRHSFITLVISLHYPVGIDPDIRANIRYLFLLSDDGKNTERIFTHYTSTIFKKKEEFTKYFERYTRNLGILVLKVDPLTRKKPQKIFHFKATKHLPHFTIRGNKIYRRCHRKNMKKIRKNKQKG